MKPRRVNFRDRGGSDASGVCHGWTERRERGELRLMAVVEVQWKQHDTGDMGGVVLVDPAYGLRFIEPHDE